MSDKIKDNFNNFKDVAARKFNQVIGSENNVVLISFIIIFFILFALLSWIYATLSNKTKSCNRINELYKEGNLLRTVNKAIPYNGNNNEILLKNFYIKTAYNCCCVDGYKNNWVDLCALKKCIYQGARCLDFEIYSYNNEPIIAASTANNNSIKETYNYEKFQDVLNIIINENINDKIDNFQDPLFLHFRIMSDNIDIYNKMGIYIKNILFRDDPNSINRCYKKNEKLILSNINDLKEQYIIMVNSKNYKNVEQSKLMEYVNLQSNGPNLRILRYQELLAAGDNNPLLIAQTKQNLIIVLPDLNNKIENYIFSKAYKNGCQFIAMKFQNVDQQLISYNKFLFKNNENKAITLKANDLLEPDQPDTEFQEEVVMQSEITTSII